MKKLIPLLIVALLATATLSFAAPDPEANRQFKRLKSRATELEADVAAAQTDIDAVEVVANAAVAKAAAAQVTTSAAAIVTTTFTPAFAGQVLIATVSNLVWVAEDATTNGWILITN
jgi:hypothetical protein